MRKRNNLDWILISCYEEQLAEEPLALRLDDCLINRSRLGADYLINH